MAVFLKLDGVDGESTDDRHRGEIELLSWSVGVTNSGGGHAGGGGGAGRATFSDLAVTKAVDQATPALFRLAATGQHVENAVLTRRTTDIDPEDFLVIFLEDVTVTSFLVADARSEDKPVENVGLAYGRLRVEVHGQDPRGQNVELGRFGWDVRENRAP